MKKITIKKLSIVNFKGIKNLQIDEDDEEEREPDYEAPDQEEQREQQDHWRNLK